jgi:hypothetical protein
VYSRARIFEVGRDDLEQRGQKGLAPEEGRATNDVTASVGTKSDYRAQSIIEIVKESASVFE